MLYTFLVLLHVIFSIALIISVLLQSSKGGGLAGTFGGSGISGGVFGGRGAAPLLVKATTVCAIVFMLTSISLYFAGSRQISDSVLENVIMQPGEDGSEPAVTNEMPITPVEESDEQSSEDSESSAEESSQ